MECVWPPAWQTEAGDAPEIGLPFSIPTATQTDWTSHTPTALCPLLFQRWEFRVRSWRLRHNILDLQNTTSAPTSASFPMLVPLATESLSLHKTPLSVFSVFRSSFRNNSVNQIITYINGLVMFLLDKTLRVSGRSNNIFVMRYQVPCHCKWFIMLVW